MTSFGELRLVNGSRKDRWHGDTDSWVGSDWSNAMAGECGEACNVVKKIRRLDLGLKGNKARDTNRTLLLSDLGIEIADTIIYADLLGRYYDLDLDHFIKYKFNAVSEEQGFPERL